VFLEVASQEISQADAARKYGVDVSVIVRLRALAKHAALPAFASAKPGRPASAEAVELELLRAENDRLSEALKEMAVELTLHRGKQSARAFRLGRSRPPTTSSRCWASSSPGRTPRGAADREFPACAVKQRAIPRRGGKLRYLGIATVRHRVGQAALKLVLEPIFGNPR
jgi:transposase-like protein